jgi:hypothetical protein
MTAADDVLPGIEQSTQALVDLVAADRARLCDEILGEAHARAQGLRADARDRARRRIRQVFEEQRARRDERLAAAEARLATERRLHAQQHLSARLRLASDALPQALQALWQEQEGRATWARTVLQAAKLRLPPGPWRLAHPVDWRTDERERALQGAAWDATPHCEADPRITAGLRVACGGIVLDGTLEGLLADRADVEARLVRRLEGTA